MIVPSASALSRIALSESVDLAISAHCARGICQLAIYEYIGGFSFASEFWAPAGRVHRLKRASAHSPMKMLHDFRVILFLLNWFRRRASGEPTGRECNGRYAALYIGGCG